MSEVDIKQDAGPTHPAGRNAWPSESEEKLRDRSKCRKKQLLAELMKKAEALNERLDVANNPKLLLAEIVAANLYTGPVRDPTLPRSTTSLTPRTPSISLGRDKRITVHDLPHTNQ